MFCACIRFKFLHNITPVHTFERLLSFYIHITISKTVERPVAKKVLERLTFVLFLNRNNVEPNKGPERDKILMTMIWKLILKWMQNVETKCATNCVPDQIPPSSGRTVRVYALSR